MEVSAVSGRKIGGQDRGKKEKIGGVVGKNSGGAKIYQNWAICRSLGLASWLRQRVCKVICLPNDSLPIPKEQPDFK